jgi:D-alanyl-D-alanine carboxypeptidase
MIKNKFTITISLLLLLTLTQTACKRHAARTATQPCTLVLDFKDTTTKHPKDALYSSLLANMQTGGIPGATLMIEDSNGLWVESMGKADIDADVDLAPCHNMKIASITKLFTAVLVHKLIDEGKLNLSDPISKYIDADIIAKLKNSEQATIADLLQHSSGIYDFVFDPEYVLYTFNNLEQDKTYEKLLSFAYNKEPAFAFRSKRSYNYTVNYILLAMAINKITGADHAYAQHQKIWTPLGMNHTFFRPIDDIPWSNVAKAYFDYRQPGTLQDLTSLFTGDGSGFTGVYSTVDDMRKLMNGVFKTQQVVSPTALANMQNTNMPNDSISYGIGSRVYLINEGGKQYHYYGHPGGEVAYASGAYYCPEKKATITFIVNYGDAFDGKYSPAYLQFRKDVLKAAVK